MEFTEFKKKIKEMVQERAGMGVSIEGCRIQKNNGIVQNGLSIHDTESGMTFTVSLEQLYEEAQKEHTNLETLADHICTCFHCRKNETEDDRNSLQDFSTVKDRIIYRLINLEMNLSLLQDVPHKVYLDFAVVFCVFMGTAKNQSAATVLIHNGHMKMWNTDVEEIEKRAEQNTPVMLQSQLQPVHEVLKAFAPAGNGFWAEAASGMPEMYIISNQHKLYGASCILYPKLLEQIAENWEKDFFLLPSSVHETILIPEEDRMKAPGLNSIIREINHTNLPAEEVLSDHAYFYSRKTIQLVPAVETDQNDGFMFTDGKMASEWRNGFHDET